MRKEKEIKCCDKCEHYHWYYDHCDFWDTEEDARSVRGCFVPRKESKDAKDMMFPNYVNGGTKSITHD